MFCASHSSQHRCLQMQHVYDDYNEHVRSSGKGYGHFMVDMCRPGHLTICLRSFQNRIHCTDDNWDAQFGEHCLLDMCQDGLDLSQASKLKDAQLPEQMPAAMPTGTPRLVSTACRGVPDKNAWVDSCCIWLQAS